MLAQGAAMIATAGAADYALLGGGAADAATPILKAGYDKLLYACLLSDACRRIIGAVITPEGPAFQMRTPEALEARDAVENGATLYKMGQLGTSAGSESQYWSMENPMLDPVGYAQRNGIPPGNVANWDMVLVGHLQEGANFITRQAPGAGTNLGGAIEVVADLFGVSIDGFTMP